MDAQPSSYTGLAKDSWILSFIATLISWKCKECPQELLVFQGCLSRVLKSIIVKNELQTLLEETIISWMLKEKQWLYKTRSKHDLQMQQYCFKFSIEILFSKSIKTESHSVIYELFPHGSFLLKSHLQPELYSVIEGNICWLHWVAFAICPIEIPNHIYKERFNQKTFSTHLLIHTT